MSEIDDLRNTIEARRAELQKLRDDRTAAQEEAQAVQAKKLLNSELAAIEAEIAMEQSLLDAQKTAIQTMADQVKEQDAILLPVSDPGVPSEPVEESNPNEEVVSDPVEVPVEAPVSETLPENETTEPEESVLIPEEIVKPEDVPEVIAGSDTPATDEQ